MTALLPPRLPYILILYAGDDDSEAESGDEDFDEEGGECGESEAEEGDPIVEPAPLPNQDIYPVLAAYFLTLSKPHVVNKFLALDSKSCLIKF